MPKGMGVGQRFRGDVLTLRENYKNDVSTLGHEILGDVPPSSRGGGGVVPDIIKRDIIHIESDKSTPIL